MWGVFFLFFFLKMPTYVSMMGLGEEKGETAHTEASETLPVPLRTAVIHRRVQSRFICFVCAMLPLEIRGERRYSVGEVDAGGLQKGPSHRGEKGGMIGKQDREMDERGNMTMTLFSGF